MIRQFHPGLASFVFCLVVGSLIVPHPCLAQGPADQIPKLDLVGVPEEFASLLEETHKDAAKHPDNPVKIGELGMLLLRIAKLNDAIQCLALAVKKQPGEMRWYYYLALAREQLLETKEAIALFRKCLELDSSYVPALIHIADLVLLDDPKQSETLYLSAQKLSPTDPRIYFGLGECARIAQQPDNAINFYKKAVELAPQYAAVHRALSRLYEEKGDKINADIHRSAEKKGREPKVVKDPLYVDLMSRGAEPQWLLDLANQLIQAGEYDMAAKFIARAGTSKQFSEESNKLLGLLAYYRQDHATAAEYLAKYLREIRGDDDNRMILVRALVELHRNQEAVLELKIILKNRPEHIESMEQLAVLDLFDGRYESAIAHLKNVIKLTPNRKGAYVDLVIALVASGDMDAAVAGYKNAARAFGGSDELDDLLMTGLLALIRHHERNSADQASAAFLNRKRFADFSGALARADLPKAAERAANYMQTIVRAIESQAANLQFGAAFNTIDKVIDADEGGCIRDVMSTTALRYSKSSPGMGERFFKDNEKRVQMDASLANMLAWIRATSADDSMRSAGEAVRLAELADKQTNHQSPEVLDTLAAAYATSGDFDRALKIMQEALRMAEASASGTRVERFKQRIALYEKKTPYRH